MALAMIWLRHSGKRPSHTIEFRSGLPDSPFNKFVDSIRRHFLRDQTMADDAFNTAMQHTSARLYWGGDKKSAKSSPAK